MRPASCAILGPYPSRRARVWALVLGVLCATQAWCGCLYDPLPDSRVCDDVAVAISSRTFDCTGDDAQANARYHAFVAATSCSIDEAQRENINGLYACPQAIAQATCDEVDLYQDDWAQWLGRDRSCAQFVTLNATADADAGVPDAGATP